MITFGFDNQQTGSQLPIAFHLGLPAESFIRKFTGQTPRHTKDAKHSEMVTLNRVFNSPSLSMSLGALGVSWRVLAVN